MKSSVEWSQVSAFRLARHHFPDQQQADLVTVCRNVCGIQAQVMSAARTALWARIHGLKQSDIHSALNESRTLVRTACVRQTVHLLPASDLSIYNAALKRGRVEAVRRGMSRFGVTDKDAARLNEAVAAALASGPMTQQELTAQVKAGSGKRIRAWMDRVWSVFRLAFAEGLVCYGPDLGRETTLARVDQWLAPPQQVSEEEARQILCRRYLSAYGPATLQDFSHWSGISMKEATPIWKSLNDELVDVSVEDKTASILRCDYECLLNAELREPILRLVPGFDPYLLAYAGKDHLVDRVFYKRVYRNQGWITPVVLLNGRVIGVWSITWRGKGSSLEAEFFQKISKRTRGKIAEEAACLGRFLETSLQISFA